MFKSSLAAAALIAAALPATAEPGQREVVFVTPAASAQMVGVNGGHQMQAALLSLEGAEFSAAELALISDTEAPKRAELISFLKDTASRSLTSSNEGHQMEAALAGVDADSFTPMELAVIANADDSDRDDLAAMIRDRKRM